MSHIDLPSENLRVKQIIDFTTDGNELEFSHQIGISQPRINRLFRKDAKKNSYPVVTLSIIQAIVNKYKNISLDWLVLGMGNMLRESYSNENQIVGNNNIQQNNNKNSIFFPPTNSSINSNEHIETLRDNKIIHLEEKVSYLKKVIETQEKLIEALGKK